MITEQRRQQAAELIKQQPIEHLKPLDKKWHDPFRFGEMIKEVIARAITEFENLPEGRRQKLIQKRFSEFARTVENQIAQAYKEYPDLLGKKPERNKQWRAALLNTVRDLRLRDKGFVPFWLAVSDLISRKGEHTQTLAKVELKFGEPIPACFEATQSNKRWLAHECGITPRMVNHRLEQGEFVGITHWVYIWQDSIG